MKVVVKLSGSLFGPELEGLDPFFELFSSLHEKGVKLAIVAGGGEVARRYIGFARRHGCDESSLDEIGIAVSRLNARLFASGLGDLAYPRIPTSLEEVGEAFGSGRIVVLGGYHPGFSTNAVAALTAERVRADLLVNATDVEGIYDSDPRVSKDAKLLKRVKVAELTAMLQSKGYGAGEYELMDLVALKVIQRSKIRTRVVLCEPEAIRRAIEGEEVGTEIVP